MRTVRDVMSAERACVSLGATVQTAVLLMREHRLAVLPVVDGDRLVGILDAATTYLYQPEVAVADIMAPPDSVDAGLSLSAAATLLQGRGLCEIAVSEDGVLVGILRSVDLLSAWAMPVDPLTGLPWQDTFRMRSSMRLASGHELTLLFFDMDDFGAINKTFGHIVGDRALRGVAGAIREALDASLDQACRFGGDEFVVSTSRPRHEAAEWAAAVRARVAGLDVEGMDGSLSVSVGVSGGLRQGERPGTHAPSNLDDLINRASRASTLAKASPTRLMSLDPEPLASNERPPVRAAAEANAAAEDAEAAYPPRPARIRCRSVNMLVTPSRARADVRLEHLGAARVASREGAPEDALRLVAQAVTDALAQYLPSGYEVRPIDVSELRIAGDEHVMMALVRLNGPDGRQNLVGVADIGADVPRSVAKAVLDAVNRPLEAITLLGSPRAGGPAAA